MTEVDAARIESELGYPLPSEYRDFLRRHADEVNRIKQLLPYRAVLWTVADAIIWQNQYSRQYADAMTIGEFSEPWPAEFLLVGTNGGGDYWFVDRSGARRGVWFWQHEAHEIEESYESFEAYMLDLRSDAGDSARWQ